MAELDPPNYTTNTTSWDFTDILPQLELVMNATYGIGKRVVPNFSTQPTWMVGGLAASPVTRAVPMMAAWL